MSFVAEVIAIGSEVLAGFTVNSNASFISKKLGSIGIEVRHHQVVGDASEEIKLGLDLGFSRSDLLVVTGGLGPTCDDLTRASIADYFGVELCLDKRVAADLKERFGERKIGLQDQATIPVAFHLFLNKVGTAPGLLFKKDEKIALFIGISCEEDRCLTATTGGYGTND